MFIVTDSFLVSVHAEYPELKWTLLTLLAIFIISLVYVLRILVVDRPKSIIELKSIDFFSNSCDADPLSREYKLWKWFDNIFKFIAIGFFTGVLIYLVRFESNDTNTYVMTSSPSMSRFKECESWQLKSIKIYAFDGSQSFEEHGSHELIKYQQSCDDHFYPTVTMDSPLKHIGDFSIYYGRCGDEDCFIFRVKDYDGLRSSLNLADFNAGISDLFERLENQFVDENARMSNDFVNKKDTALMQLTEDAKTMETWK